ncbi:hypothetical protein [Pseudoxanthomonas yeongjuensis]|jgi:hypothetical protein|nr:hypothetical protein [Pseudoxanthomonas yeongjuensis]
MAVEATGGFGERDDSQAIDDSQDVVSGANRIYRRIENREAVPA